MNAEAEVNAWLGSKRSCNPDETLRDMLSRHFPAPLDEHVIEWIRFAWEVSALRRRSNDDLSGKTVGSPNPLPE